MAHNQKKTTSKRKAASKKKAQKIVPEVGRAYVTATFNNTLVTFTNQQGQVITWGSAGTAGFKNTRKSTSYAATTAVKQVADKVKAAGLKEVAVFIKGPGLGRDAAVRAIRAAGLKITALADISPLPHNGCRPKKRRRV